MFAQIKVRQGSACKRRMRLSGKIVFVLARTSIDTDSNGKGLQANNQTDTSSRNKH